MSYWWDKGDFMKVAIIGSRTLTVKDLSLYIPDDTGGKSYTLSIYNGNTGAFEKQPSHTIPKISVLTNA